MNLQNIIKKTNEICNNLNEEIDRVLGIPKPAPEDTISGLADGVYKTLPNLTKKRKLGRYVVRKPKK